MTKTRKLAPSFTFLLVQLVTVELPPPSTDKRTEKQEATSNSFKLLWETPESGCNMYGPLKMNHIYAFDVQLLNYFSQFSLTFIGIFLCLATLGPSLVCLTAFGLVPTGTIKLLKLAAGKRIIAKYGKKKPQEMNELGEFFFFK